jgi:hypothetical protein
MRLRLAVLPALLLLSACAPKAVRIPLVFDKSKATTLLAPGSNQINGKVRLELENGTMISCTGNTVNLVPATAYAREWVRQFYETDGGKYGSMDAAYRLDDREAEIKFQGAESFYATTRTTRCDDDGEFTFGNVANGEFFVIAKVRWLGRDHEYYDFLYGINNAQEEDGSVMERVRLNGDQVVDLQWKARGAGLLGGEGLASGR